MSETVNNFSAALRDYLSCMPDVVTAIEAIEDPAKRIGYLAKAIERVALEPPEALLKPALELALSLVRPAELVETLIPEGPPLVVRIYGRENETRRGESVEINGRRVKLPARAVNILRMCERSEYILADDRAMKELLKLDDLKGEIERDDTRSRKGHAYRYRVSPRLAAGIQIIDQVE